MRIYELVFICKPDLTEEDVDSQVEAVQKVIEEGGGKIDKLEKWGKKRLAYRVQKYADGFYVLMQYSLEENLDLPKEVERRLRVADPVIKFLTVRIDEELKRIAKAKASREKRAARKPAAAAPSRPAPSKSDSPGAPAPGRPGGDDNKGDNKGDDKKGEDDKGENNKEESKEQS